MAGTSEVFSDADHERVNQAVREAESSTSAEILPVVARSSGRYDRPEDIVGLWFAALAMIIVWFVFPLSRIEAGNWDAPAPVWQLVALLAGALVGFVALFEFQYSRQKIRNDRPAEFEQPVLDAE